jgi:NAD(P)-dependent dehydrogenase (short-subunit alcohol dehydrogenase family)
MTKSEVSASGLHGDRGHSDADGIAGKVAFVTGGGTGIGRACARRIIAAGAKVIIAGRREAVLREACEALGENAGWEACDAADEDGVAAAVERTVERYGSLDLAVNAAGIGSGGNLLQLDTAGFEAVMRTNLLGTYAAMRAEVRAMLAAGRGGSIVNVSSIAAVLTHKGMSAYCVSKAAVNMLTRCMADDLGHKGIRVNAVMPGLVATDIVAELLAVPSTAEAYRAQMPIGREGQPDEVAAMVLTLLGDRAAWVTGQCIGVDGGNTLRAAPDFSSMFGTAVP